MTDRNGLNVDPSQNREIDRVNPDSEQGIQSYIAPSIRQAVSQYQGLLRQGLEQEVQRIIYEVESATVDIESTINKRIKSRLKDLVQDEVRRIFDNALSGAENSLIDPAWSQDWRGRPSVNRQPQRNDIVEERETIVREPEAEDDPGDWTGGSNLEPPPQPGGPSPVNVEREATDDFEYSEPPLPPGQPLTAQETVQEPVNYQSSEIEPVNEEPVAPAEEATGIEDDSEYQPIGRAELEEEPPDLQDEEVEAIDDVEDGEDIYEGTVRLNIEANDCIRQVVSFVRELRQKPQFRLLRLVGNNREGVDIWLSLREPLHLKKMLPQIEGVSLVTSQKAASSGNERLLMVRLTKDLETQPQEATAWADNHALSEATEALA